jgi:hypothetical protein
MMAGKLTIGNAQAFWGDSPGAAARLVKQWPDLDYLTMDYLSEVSMSILAIQREKDPQAGYARDFLDVIKSLVPLWNEGAKVRLVTNAGGLNPFGCAQACAEILRMESNRSWKIGIVDGDDVLNILTHNPHQQDYQNLETHAPLSSIENQLVTANAYLGAYPIVKALQEGADIVITGRVADPSLTVAPCMASFNWSWQDYDKIAGATIAGHLIECGTQATGGFCTNWLAIPDSANMGFPVVEVSSDGSFVLTKPEGTGGIVSEQTVKEQLLYEIGDPDNYLSPDITASFLSLKLQTLGPNRVHISGAKGKPAPEKYKVSATYRDGYKLEGFLSIFGPQAPLKARRCGEIILEKVKQAGFSLSRTSIECLGALDIVPGVFSHHESEKCLECVLRIAAADPRKEALEYLAKEIAPLVTSGPQGVTGYTSGRPHVREVFGYWPCLIEHSLVHPHVKILEVTSGE